MTPAVLVNGVAPSAPEHAIALNDRGFHYGDGVFETTLLSGGRVRFLDDHLQRLATGCERLGIRPPLSAELMSDIERVIASEQRGVLKIVVTRGVGARGYRPDLQLQPTRVVALYPALPQPPAPTVTLRWCSTRLARNACLAGIKHLNRLEHVLAQAEWHDASIDEGLMLDTEGELVCGTASNVFLVRDGVLVTPDLRFCGVRGIMRARVLRSAHQLGIPVSEQSVWRSDVTAASELFITNAVRGLRAAVSLCAADNDAGKLNAVHWPFGPIAQQLRAALES